MDKSKMAEPGTTISYNPNKGRNDGMSRDIKTACHDWCCCEHCQGDGNKSLDDTLNPPEPDKYGPVCCGGS